MTKYLLKCLEDISKLGSPGWTTLESARNALIKAKNLLSQNDDDDRASGIWSCKDGEVAAALLRIHTTYAKLLINVFDKESSEADVRVECGCFAASLLQEVLHQLEASEDFPSPNECQNTKRVPPPPPNLLSLHQIKIVEDTVRVIIYTVVLGCVETETSRYLKTTLAKTKFVLGQNLVVLPQSKCLVLLISTMKLLLPIMKHENLGNGVQKSLFPDLLTVLLELCFAPYIVKSQQEHVTYFRQQLQEVMSSTHSATILSHILFLLGFVTAGSWLGRACGALMVRRFLTQPGGIAAVVGAGLSICEGQDWRCCEAVAAVIARARTNDLAHYYSTVGPQMCELMQHDDQKPEVMRVVILTVAELAHRSAELTGRNITSPFLLPLYQTTRPDALDLCKGSNLTPCLSQVYKVFVEIPPPSLALTSLLKPVLKPLVMAAALPTTHLRSTARYVIVRYLSQMSKEDAVDALITMSSLKSSPESPAVNPNITFSVNDTGGIKVDERTDLHNSRVLEDDENMAKCLIYILEQLKNSCVVLMFYEKLTEHIDFTVFSKKENPHTLLLTDDDVRLINFEKMRRIFISCSLLENLSESEVVTNDLFVNLSAAMPVVSSLIKTGCQLCEEEQIQQIQTSLIMNILMLISCYVSERTGRKKMSSEDWMGLKSLLPALEEVIKSSCDEAILLLVEQLKNLVLTHGAVTVKPRSVLEAKKLRDNASSLYKRKCLSNNGLFYDSELGNNQLAVQKTKEKERNGDMQPKVKISNIGHSKEVKKESHMNLEQASDRNKTYDSQLKVESNVDTEDIREHDSQLKKEQDVQKDTKSEKDEVNCNKNESSYQEAMEDLFSPLLPVRGHALLALGKLLEKRDKETLAHSKQLFSIFQHNLKEDDSYLYLMAVEGLAVLCNIFPNKVVEILTREFSLGERNGEDRAKLAEVLVRATRRLGPLLPHYRDLFVNSLLNGMRAQERMVRAASLSALGEVCKLLKFSLGPIIHEIFFMLHDAVKNDDAPEVRGAAVLVVTLLLQGLGQDTFTILQEVIRDLYRLLRLIHATDPDQTVRLHAQVAIEEVDAATRRFLMPRLSLTKRIYVTEMPRTAL
ncbi:hypothetical protein Pcinc_035187 [Petrolisthes cinctipes]|uniref:Uncharacterized protein n=1 Tax=Petrolisthes cinctipes TaxID=88211 RepID=A0AAE1ENI8_PETCI|nr:hypothetical protein Pcinc_035187 [Petrolisthes cinctipes]